MKLTRRAVLRGLGTAVALPFLASLAGRRAGAVDPEPIRRLIVLPLPNGMPMDAWRSTGAGLGYTPSTLVAELGTHLSRTTVIEGLRTPAGIGEPHHTASLSWLTGRATAPWAMATKADFVSVDQVAARALGASTRFTSLELSSDPPVPCSEVVGGQQPTCAGYWTSSWSDADTPRLPEVDVRRAFDRLFASGTAGESAAARARRQRYGHGVLDFVRDDAARLKRALSSEDAVRLDQYLTGVEEVERALDALPPPPTGACAVGAAALEARVDLDAPMVHAAHVDVMLDLVTLALQCDATRVVTYAMSGERSDRPFPELGIAESHHAISHHGGDPTKLAKLEAISRWELGRVRDLLDRLAATPDGDGTLLDQTLVLAGCCISDPDLHDPRDLPTLLLGADAWLPSRGRIDSAGASMASLHLAVLQKLGVATTRFGDDGVEPLAGL